MWITIHMAAITLHTAFILMHALPLLLMTSEQVLTIKNAQLFIFSFWVKCFRLFVFTLPTTQTQTTVQSQAAGAMMEGAFHRWHEVLAVMTDSFSHWYIICEPVSWKTFSHICDWLPAVSQGWIVLREAHQKRWSHKQFYHISLTQT